MIWYDIMYWELINYIYRYIKIEERFVHFVLVRHSTCCILCGTIGIFHCQALQIHALQCHPNTGVAHFKSNSGYMLANLAFIMYYVLFRCAAMVPVMRWGLPHVLPYRLQRAAGSRVLRNNVWKIFDCCFVRLCGYQMPNIYFERETFAKKKLLLVIESHVFALQFRWWQFWWAACQAPTGSGKTNVAELTMLPACHAMENPMLSWTPALYP